MQGSPRLHVGLSASLGFTVGINAYLSAPGAVALKPHTDGHDVAVLQLQGRTRWNVCPAATADRGPGTGDRGKLTESDAAEALELEKRNPLGCTNAL